MTLVLGICDGHDAGACLAEDGKILAAVSEERLTRRKRQAGFPFASVQWCLEFTGASPEDVRLVAVAERSGRMVHRLFDGIYRRTDPNRPMQRASNQLSMSWQNFFASNGAITKIEASASELILKKRIDELGFRSPLKTVDHHLAHALSAAACSGFGEALVVTMDAFGDGCSGSVSLWKDGKVTELQRIPYPHSPALLYGMTTSYLGFVEGDEGKVAGLAARGDARATRHIFDEFFSVDDESIRIKYFPSFSRLRAMLHNHSAEDIAAGLQESVQDLTSRFIAGFMKRTRSTRLCLAGGLFANVRLNQAAGERCACEDLFVFPHMGDGGLCAGAALAHSEMILPAEPMTPFLGPEAGNLPAIDSLEKDFAVTRLNATTAREIAVMLVAGGAVGIARGRMEFGPRALGNRSILFPAKSRALAERINAALNRPPIMPFAPAIREDDFAAVTGAPRWTAFKCMTVTAPALPGVAERFPVAVHGDGTMRIQAVNKECGLLYDILTEYGRGETPGLLINTSFNMHTEPIVESAAGAIELFRRLPLTGLVAGDLFLKEAQPR